MTAIQQRCSALSNSPVFMNIIISLIIINAILIGLETYPQIANTYGHWLMVIDAILLWIFTVEIVIRLIGSTSIKAFFKDPWSVFDFVIVLSGHLLVGSYVTVLRILRVLRVLRAISIIPSLRKMVNALLLTIPSMGTILLLLGLFFYVYGVIGTLLYHSIAPEYFGTLHQSLLTLFQVITLESWASGVMRPILAEDPSSWWYFVTFILIGAFVIVNLFVGVVVNNVEEANREESPSPTDIKLAELQKELAEIKQLLRKQKD
ncbi:voltage-gated sodium channel [Virgibacillus dokdonensis]|uniref:Voltage-gated sodium channel n=2 Tax=Virgibacillus TaxID=84406 RepID=A0A1M5R6B1_9BACI|nr:MULTISPECIES: ion transporter [Virgibacillus]RFA34259.1 voltage-gated sodium channel [Virgibacillus dokdonensis]SHH21626.1 voltage-gated sodium channel [Virgibacillus chiguensis]